MLHEVAGSLIQQQTVAVRVVLSVRAGAVVHRVVLTRIAQSDLVASCLVLVRIQGLVVS